MLTPHYSGLAAGGRGEHRMGPVAPGVLQEASRLLAPTCGAAAAPVGGVTDPSPRCEGAAAGIAVEDYIATKFGA